MVHLFSKRYFLCTEVFMANIREVAKEAGVSPAAVSRILSGDPSFHASGKTREAVATAVKKLHYVPRAPKRAAAAAPAGKADREYRIGCILPASAEKYGDPFFDAILAAAEDVCVRNGARISTRYYYRELGDPHVLGSLIRENLDGLFMMERVDEEAHEIISRHIPNMVYVDCDEIEYSAYGVGFDHIAANRLVMRHLLGRGYRRIGLISGGSEKEPLSQSYRYMVYIDELRRAGIPFDPSLVMDSGWDLEECAACTKKLLGMPDPPDAIFAGSDSLASVVLGTLYSMDLRCPRDVGVIGFNNLEVSAHLIPPLTTVDIPTADIGRTAGEWLMEMIRGNAGAVRKILFPTALIERGSLRQG